MKQTLWFHMEYKILYDKTENSYENKMSTNKIMSKGSESFPFTESYSQYQINDHVKMLNSSFI